MVKINESIVDFGITLKEVRKNNNLTQVDLANKTGIKRATIASYEKGSRKISSENLALIRQALDNDDRLILKEEKLDEIISSLIRYQQINGITKKEVAELTGIDSSVLTKILNGKRKPSASVIKKIELLFSDSNENITKKIINEHGIPDFPKVNREEMGIRINKIRKKREESLAVFGKHMTQVTGKNVISRWEKGINIPDIEKLMNVAYLGETTVSYILYGSTYKRMLKQKRRKNFKFKKLDTVYLGRRLRKIRRDYRLEREDFGEMFDPTIRKWSMDRYENGKDIPNTERLVQYAFLGNTSLEFLIYGI